MKRLLFLAFLFIGTAATAQNIKLYLQFEFANEEDSKKVPLVKITVKDMETGEVVKNLKSDSNGNVTKVTVPIQKVYWIQAEKEGWCTKTYHLDTKHDSPGDLPRVINFVLDEQIFKVEDKECDYLQEEPMREFLFTETGGFTWKKEEGVRADKKLKLVHLNKVPAKQAEKWLVYMEAAEKAEKAGNKDEALKSYYKAHDIHPSNEVEDAIKRCGGELK